MNAIDNGKNQENDISLGLLLDMLAGIKDAPLVFYYDGQPVKSGYHITEVKAGQFAGLDCGANPETWSEIFIQLWDVEENDRKHMATGKFCAIVRRVTEHVRLDASARLTFEVSDGVRPMQLYCATMPVLRAGAVHVALSPRPASCKPRDRWLAEENKKAVVCCGPSAAGSACCA
ncbi:conserved hypothetical protein [Rhizobium leguminosarum bv. trifolii WSM2304]|uniref:Uncharacterized protein n=1 Tax=Rhizobium leguminosarum bv. trifolii (strain WSM2304) TaxID=395492 RepID=A0ABF7QMV1_RHILW|nr:DUF6428 family protein [Rhizobium leguminosarum]ACI55441.1 conserved hypothetical protein [Rhizobium leguminosarum bv. trifolii WSM2304]